MKAKFCPKCKNKHIELVAGGQLGMYECKKCGFRGTIFPEKEITLKGNKKKQKIKIRDIIPEDFKAVAKAFAEEFRRKPYWERWNTKNSLKRIEYLYERGDTIKVALIDDTLAGFIVYNKEPWYTGYWVIVSTLVIKKEFQGEGIGKALILEVEKQSKKEGITTLILESSRFSPAFKFYKKLKYLESGWTVMHKDIM